MRNLPAKKIGRARSPQTNRSLAVFQPARPMTQSQAGRSKQALLVKSSAREQLLLPRAQGVRSVPIRNQVRPTVALAGSPTACRKFALLNIDPPRAGRVVYPFASRPGSPSSDGGPAPGTTNNMPASNSGLKDPLTQESICINVELSKYYPPKGRARRIPLCGALGISIPCVSANS